jgi:hypothetical protein
VYLESRFGSSTNSNGMIEPTLSQYRRIRVNHGLSGTDMNGKYNALFTGSFRQSTLITGSVVGAFAESSIRRGKRDRVGK